MSFLKLTSKKYLNELDHDDDTDYAEDKMKRIKSSLILPLNITKHLEQDNLYHDLKINQTGSLSFHWADWVETCLLQSHITNSDYALSKRMGDLKDNIEMLKFTPVWLDKSGRRIKATLYELYQSYFDPRMRMILFEGPKDRFLVSLQGPQGPFIDVPSLRWFDKDIYLNFVFLGLIKKNMPFRKFRLRFNAPADFISKDQNLFSMIKISCHQITREGIIWTLPRSSITKILEFSNLIFKVNFSSMLKEVMDLYGPLTSNALFIPSANANPDELREFNTFTIDLAKCLKHNKDITSTKEISKQDFFIFTRFEAFEPIAENNFLNKVLQPLIKNLESNFMEQVEKIKDKKAI